MGRTWPLTGRTSQLALLRDWYDDSTAGGVLVGGPAGVGKTRLADEIFRMADTAGRPVARAFGHPGTQPIPLGALAHLFPAEIFATVGVGEDERAGLFHAGRASLVGLAGEHRLLLVIDDIDYLDETSLALLLPLAIERVAFLVATIRAGRPTPAAVVSLLKEGHFRRLDLTPLERDDVATLLQRVLDGPIEPSGLKRLSTLSGGNLQVLTELVHAARDRGELVKTNGHWTLGELPTTAGLEDLVVGHLATVDGKARDALEALAVAGRAGLADLDAWCDPGTLEALETDGLVRVVSSERRVELTLAHPLYGEILRARLPVLRLRALRRQLADRLEAHGAKRSGDACQLALWRLEAGGDVDPELLLRAARLALAGRNAELAVRFATAGRDGAPPGDVAQVLVEAYAMLIQLDDLEATVAGVWDRDDLSDAHRAHLARRRAEVSLAARRDADAALRAIEQGLERVTQPTERASLTAHRASLLATVGRPLEALETLTEVPEVDDARVRTEVAAARANALLSQGHFAGALAAAKEGAAAQRALPPWLVRRGMAQHLINEIHAYGYSGRYREARELAEPAAERALHAGALGAWLWLEIVLGEIARDSGRAHETVRRFSTAVDAAERVGQHAALVWAHVGVAQGYLLLGEGEAAAEALADADAAGDSPVSTSSATRERTRAWLDACRGDLAGARRRIADIADAVAADGIYTFEAALRHDLVRFGDAAVAVDRLGELEAMIDGPVLPALAEHARGVAAHDPGPLQSSLERFVAMDSLVMAAETAADLADAWRRGGDQRAAAAAARRSAQFVEAAGGARTPPLLRGTGVGVAGSRPDPA